MIKMLSNKIFRLSSYNVKTTLVDLAKLSLFILGTEAFLVSLGVQKSFVEVVYFCFMNVSNVFLLGTEAVFVFFVVQKSILTV